MKRKILIMGGTSYIGDALFKKIPGSMRTYHKKQVKDGIYFDALSSDLQPILKSSNFSHAVILLGDTNPDSCAKDIVRSNKLNVESIKSIIDALVDNGIKPVFASSQFIFDGKKGSYAESDVPSPILTYGRQKVAIEAYLKKKVPDHIIIRISKAFGKTLGDNTLFTSWIDDISANKKIYLAADQIFSPILIDDLVEGINILLAQDATGVFNLCGTRSHSRLEFFEMLLRHLNDHKPAKADIVKCSINDFPLVEKRPLDVSMKPDKIIGHGLNLHDTDDICENIVIDYIKRERWIAS